MLNRRPRPVRITVPGDLAARAASAHEHYLATRAPSVTDPGVQAAAEQRLAEVYRQLAGRIGWPPLFGALLAAAAEHTEHARPQTTPRALPAGESGVAA